MQQNQSVTDNAQADKNAYKEILNTSIQANAASKNEQVRQSQQHANQTIEVVSNIAGARASNPSAFGSNTSEVVYVVCPHCKHEVMKANACSNCGKDLIGV